MQVALMHCRWRTSIPADGQYAADGMPALGGQSVWRVKVRGEELRLSGSPESCRAGHLLLAASARCTLAVAVSASSWRHPCSTAMSIHVYNSACINHCSPSSRDRPAARQEAPTDARRT